MGTDPLLGASPLLGPEILTIVLLSLSGTAGPVLRGHEVLPSRIRVARLASVAMLLAPVPVVLTEKAGGLHGFIIVAGLVLVAAATLPRARRAAF
ncbi:hypothetical protein [Kocuria rosea]|uniref:hypothetical protein n=1 Tax=Kocuria rosea TaxID=1275 RepID=UPI000A4026BA|nr:hypothetical protein [Kocuria polaris]